MTVTLTKIPDLADQALPHYLTCALWSSSDWDDLDDSTNPAPMDEHHDIGDISAATIWEARQDLRSFLTILSTQGDLTRYLTAMSEPGTHSPDTDADAIWAQLGHDLWLTRNHHGAGFWDRGLGRVGYRLTAVAESFGGLDLYVGDDGEIHG